MKQLNFFKKMCISEICTSKILSVILSMVIALTPIFINSSAVYAKTDIPEEFEQVARSQNLSLYCNMKTGAIAVEDRRNGYVWRSVVDSKVYDMTKSNEQLKAYMTSMVVINAIDPESKEKNIQKVYSSFNIKNLKIERKNNGLSQSYFFPEVGIGVVLDIVLENDSLVVKVPVEKIQQTGKKGLLSIEPMPFFGASDHTVDGYMFYPDGSGAITRYGNADQRAANVKEYVWNVEGTEQVDLGKYYSRSNDMEYQAMLPVYGIKNGDNAILAVSCEDETDTNIRVQPEGYIIGLNRIFFELNYRHFYNINLSNVSINGKNSANSFGGIKVDKTIIQENREVRLFFLNGENADYSGMANTYREYLQKNDQLKKVIKEKDEIPLGVDFFMGIKEERLLIDKFIPMTTFKNAAAISEDLKKSGINNMQVMLKGWTKGGYGLYPINWPPDRRLGGSKGLKDYAEYAQKNNIKLFMQNDFIQANVKNGGFSTKKDVVMQGSNLPVTDYSKKYFILNPAIALRRVLSYFNIFTGYGKAGTAFNNIGAVVYHDYNKENPSGREETTQKWQEMMKEALKDGKPLAVDGGNKYVLKYADRLYNIPVQSSNYQITDEAVPFYQMVVHGMIPYTSEPANLSYSITEHKLKWVEYGCMPYFELTYKKSVELKKTDNNTLFTSYYGDWSEQAAEIYKEFNTRLASVWNQNMTGHEKMGENLYKVEYSGGTVIYINYGNTDAECEKYKVKAQDYLVVEKGGSVK